MPMTVPFDTLNYAKKLEETGMPVAQAQAQAQVLADVLSRTVTFPTDLTTLEHRLSAEIQGSESRVENKLSRLDDKLNLAIAELKGESSLLRWMNGVIITLIVAVFLKLFLH